METLKHSYKLKTGNLKIFCKLKYKKYESVVKIDSGVVAFFSFIDEWTMLRK